ncbi:23S rRNA (adenine(1618)-N(6))-methyltransferase RlmF [Neptunomonas phycophila]|uniref:23S rRNA (adenine(1618)-N(6))-methyltransferase RlmF n=1 Tax=Neptunomonas phycophila TaxID=1572645 RepID=UPI0026E19941|nr:23S rRNA (adenine(1618)-N(6))-methyltransferase RlmF [Neptunomonas phycophila]MDO6469048.1 23S rRNA (adenine(1618)-N(6))-methyltransferase RlmF [Neptunomonas phycophila]
MKPKSRKTVSRSPASQGKGLHQRNIHNSRYDFPELIAASPELSSVVTENKFGDLSINFSDPRAVKLLNQALLKLHYQIDFWDLPEGYLCPPIPGRADYIHYIADLLSLSLKGALSSEQHIPRGKRVSALDIGMGANCIYPILGARLYGWKFVGSDVNAVAVNTANTIAQMNATLKSHIRCRLQSDSQSIFKGVVAPNERFDVTLCNPPFHRSIEEATEGSERKIKNLAKNSAKKSPMHSSVNPSDNSSSAFLNFGGQGAELWCPGGEVAFITRMMQESRDFSHQCLWFTSLVSKQESLSLLKPVLNKMGVAQSRVINMQQGNKQTRILCWSFLSETEQAAWANERWLINQ